MNYVMEEVVIWGAGKLGQLFYYRNNSNYNILYFIDNNPVKIGKTIEDIPIRKWNGTCDCKILIAVDCCKDIVLALVEKGLHWPKDFDFVKLMENPIFYDDIAKIPAKDRQYLKKYFREYQVVCVYGNC